MPIQLLIDFDSTIVQVESLDELAKIALGDSTDRIVRTKRIEEITALGMSGKIGFGESLKKRLALFSPTQHHVEELITLLNQKITPSFRDNIADLLMRTENVYVISGGFREFIVPVVQEFGITSDHVLANNFVFDSAGHITGFVEDNLLSQDNGKVKAVRNLGLTGTVIAVGDGHSDWQLAEAGLANAFVAYAENVVRPSVTSRTSMVALNFSDVSRFITLPMASFT